MIILWIFILLLILTGIGFGIRAWLDIYNDYQHMATKADNLFSNIYVVRQERLDNIFALVKITEHYDIHEFETYKNVIDSRARFIKEKVTVNPLSPNLQAISERYPELKANQMFNSLMDRDIEIEKNLRIARKDYNAIAQEYNEDLRSFPRNIIAHFHKMQPLGYIRFRFQEDYEPGTLFSKEITDMEVAQ